MYLWLASSQSAWSGGGQGIAWSVMVDHSGMLAWEINHGNSIMWIGAVATLWANWWNPFGLVPWKLHGLFRSGFLCSVKSIFIIVRIIIVCIIVSPVATIATMNNPTLQAKIDSAVTILKTIEDAIEEANLEPHESITIDVSGTPNPEPPLTMPVSEWIHIIQAMRVTIVQLGMQIHNRN
jgi:hypothetical protein